MGLIKAYKSFRVSVSCVYVLATPSSYIQAYNRLSPLGMAFIKREFYELYLFLYRTKINRVEKIKSLTSG